MKRLMKSKNSGQSLVFVAIISIALFAALALAMDVGYTYAMRRWAQNAADAGALAGANELCRPEDTANRFTRARAAGIDFGVNRNRYLNSSMGFTQTASVFMSDNDGTIGDNKVRVDVSIQYPTLASRFFGRDTESAPATATAQCACPNGAVGAGVVPIAWRCTNFNNGDCQDIQRIPNDHTCTRGVDPIFVFFDLDSSGGNTIYKTYWCTQWGPPPVGLTGVISITCDSNGDNVADIIPISPLNPTNKWFWVDTDGNNCSASDENNIIQNGLTTPMYKHYWYPECSGNMGSAYNNLDSVREGSRVIIPVFDRECQATDPTLPSYDANCHAGPRSTNPLDAVTDIRVGGAGNSNTNWYHLGDFELLHIRCVAPPAGGPQSRCENATTDARGWLMANNPSGQGNQSKIGGEPAFEGCFVGGFIPGFLGPPGPETCSQGAYTIFLVK
jgi:hypothetical protein